MRPRLALLTLVACLSFGCGAKTQGTLKIINAQSRAVEELKVTLGGTEGVLSTLGPQGGGQLAFSFHGEGAYKVRLRYGKDEWVERKLGILSAGMAFEDTLRIEPNRLVLQSRQWPQGRPAEVLETEFVEKYSTTTPAAPGGNNKKVEAP